MYIVHKCTKHNKNKYGVFTNAKCTMSIIQNVHKCKMHINIGSTQMHYAHKHRIYTNAQCTWIQNVHNAHEYSAQLVSNRASVGNCHLASSLPPCHSRSHTFYSESSTLFNLPKMLYSESFTLFNLPKMFYSLYILNAFL